MKSPRGGLTQTLGLAAATLLAGLVAVTPLAAVTVFTDGSSNTVHSSQTECDTIKVKSKDLPQLDVKATCSRSKGEAFVKAEYDSFYAVRTGRAHAISRFSFPFAIEKHPEVGEKSFVPIHVELPVTWVNRLWNNDTSGQFNSAWSSITLRLWRDPIGAANGRGTRVVAKVEILNAAHRGNMCLTIPTGSTDVALMALDCLLGLSQSLNGKSLATLNAVVETGRDYNLELQVRADVEKRTRGVVLLRAVTRNRNNDHPGVKWSTMRISVGTDGLNAVARIESEVSTLRRRLDDLQLDFVGHEHSVLVTKPD